MDANRAGVPDDAERARRRRAAMVAEQIAARGVRDPALLAAMTDVPRERFVDAPTQRWAFDDGPLPIGCEQTISQPYIVAAMIEAARVQPGAVVLEVGAGSGYAAAVLSRIAREVCAIERHASLAEAARRRLADLGYANVDLRHGDGTRGWPEPRTFDAIVVSAAGAQVPPALRAQLAVGGRMVIPVDEGGRQWLVRIVRREPDVFEQERLEEVRFVPLVAGD